MDNRLIQSAKQLNKRRRRRRIWIRSLLMLSCAVALGTIYAMSLPAITQEKDIYCGIDIHEHTVECYTKLETETTPERICTLQEAEAHVHLDMCYELRVIHEHAEACYEVTGGHTHGDACYEVTGGHTHGDSCYELTEESMTLVCALEEAEGERTLICTMEEAEGERTLVCTLDATETEQVLICLLEEQQGHTHSEECFQWTDEDPLTCGLAETAEHKHTELCYGYWELTCRKEVHEHSLICHSNPNADVETASQWEKTFRDVEITGLHRVDLLNIARTQLGYQESTRNYIVKDDGTTVDGYTRYGDWYGYSYGEWCAMFVSFCLEYAEVPDVPYNSGCQAWISVLNELNMFVDRPEAGYLVFFDWNGDNYADHVGLVEEIRNDGTIVTIEGNNGKKVARAEYAADDPRLMGYGFVPEGELREELRESVETEAPTEELPTENTEPTGEETFTEPTEEGDPTETTENTEPTGEEIPTETEAPAEVATEPVDTTQYQKIPVYTNNKREELAADADEIYVAGELPEGANVYAVPVTVEMEGEILSAYQINILLPDFTAYHPTPENGLKVTLKSPKFEETYLEIRLCQAEGEYRTVPGNVTGQDVTFTLDAHAPFVIVKAAAPKIEQTIRAVIYTDETLQQKSEDETVILISGILPEGAVARAYPVMLEEDLIEGQTVLLAYDITIVDREGNFVESGEEGSFMVKIQPPGWTPSDDENYNIYYVPENGEPEMIATESQEDAVSFETDHFSTYALTASGTSDTVYLNGSSGNDSYNGTASNRAVKTLDRALALVKDGGTIYITGTVNVSGDQEWDMTGSITIKRYSNFTEPLVKVESGSSLTLKNITINGGSGTPSSSNIATNTSYASGSAKAPLIVVESGATLNIRDGAVLEYNSNKPNTNSGGTNIVVNGYIGMGGAVYCQGNLNMSGGTIRYCEAQCGGGIYIESAGSSWITFNLTGGTITNNYARDIVPVPSRGHKAYHKNAGGGVYVGDYVTMNMSGGTISNNKSSREGGGVSLGWLNRNSGSAIYEYITRFNMTGGTFTGNYATSTGGGLNVTAGRAAEISAGYFTNNTAEGLEYQPGDSDSSWSVYSGGAIYLDSKQHDSNGNYAGKAGYAKIHRVLISNNSADLYGGGIATCSTSSGTVNASLEMDGTLIYNNTAGSGGNEMYLQGNTTLVGKMMLGGGTYSWSKSGVYYDNSLTENSTDVKNGKPLATVIITGNHAGVDGGGIGCNGDIEIGGQPETVSISITKVWNDDGTVAHPDSITVQVYDGNKPYGDPITIYPAVDESGKETWPTVYVDDLPEGGNYSVKEVNVPGFDSQVKGSGNSFTITNTPVGFTVVKKWVGDTANDRPDSIQIQLFQNGMAYGDPVTLTASNNWKYMWMNLPDGYTYTAREVEVPDGYYTTGDGELLDEDTWQITNTLSPVTSVSVEKRWEGGDPLESVTVYLLSNGVQIDEVTLSAANGWFYKWEDLPVYGKLGDELEYTVQEASVRGFTSTVHKASPEDALRSWTAVTSLASGKTYLLVSSQGALTLSGGKFTWTDVSAILNGNGTPDSSQLWAYTSSKLQNGTGNWLKLNKEGGFLSGYTYYFEDSSSSGTITYNNGYLQGETSGLLSNVNRYFGSLKDDGNANAESGTSSAIAFKAYEFASNESKWGSDHYIVTNTKLPDSIEFRFTKYAVSSSSDPVLLAGAQLELYKVSETGDVTIPGTEQTGTLIRSWTSENNNYEVVDLYSGTYYLIETHTPGGHIGLSGPIIFEVRVETGEVNVISAPYELTLGSGPGVDFPIHNKIAYKMPETGGPGTTLYTIGGLLLITIALALLLYNNKRRRGAATYY